MKKRRRSMLPRGDINVTPMIDILLVLLVIFMTITPMTPTGLKTDVPQQPPPGPQSQNSEKVIVLSMDRNGVIKINQNEIEPSQLIERLQDIFKTRNDRTMFVQAADELLFNDVAQLIDAAKGAGVDRVGLMTE
ncbi:MAG: biopolymer transporter ExbD [Acidobacteria bacterium]|nr:MAG: biopolymer transporter ExbD [Acidobacteriota bacterium]